MEDNLYAPPKAKLESIPTTADSVAKRPVSHIVVALYFTLAIALLVWLGDGSARAGAGGYIGQLGMAAGYLVALVALISTRAKWAYFFVSLLLVPLPAFLIFSEILIFVKIKGVPIDKMLPMLIGSGLFVWLFSAFSFGAASRTYYGFNRSSDK